MKSVVFAYINNSWEECVSVWNEMYYNTVKKQARQIAWLFWIDHSKKYREDLMQLEQDQLLFVLTSLKEENPQYVEYPN